MSENGLTYYIHDGAAAFRFELAGTLSHRGAAELEQVRQTAASIFGGRFLVVDLTGIESVDAAGHELLEKWHGLGAQFVVSSRTALERIQAMTCVPCRDVRGDRENRGWLTQGTVVTLLAVVLALFSAAASAVARGGGDPSSIPLKGEAR
jgi:anti-anti-sigma regulatory factor